MLADRQLSAGARRDGHGEVQLFVLLRARLFCFVRPRVKDVDFAREEITVGYGKGRKDRVTPWPAVPPWGNPGWGRYGDEGGRSRPGSVLRSWIESGRRGRSPGRKSARHAWIVETRPSLTWQSGQGVISGEQGWVNSAERRSGIAASRLEP